MSDARPLRRDAQRNRDRLLAVAREALTADADSSTESIATRAGVGIGTLFRHFPTRDALVEAVYRHELDALCDQALAPSTEPPVRALRAWMGRYADFVATKRGMAKALRNVIASGAVSSPDTRAHLARAVAHLLADGAADGSLRTDVAAEDVVATLAGVVLAASPGEQTQRVLDLVVDGLRAR